MSFISSFISAIFDVLRKSIYLLTQFKGKNPGNSGSQSKILKVSFGITAAVIATICLVAAYFARRRIASKNGGNSAKVSWSRKRARSRSQTYDHIQRDKVLHRHNTSSND